MPILPRLQLQIPKARYTRKVATSAWIKIYIDYNNRHVRVHHGDKDKDDPQLREVMSQRPDGPSRGRKRRLQGP
jgi:hypothetical protein